MFLQSCSACSCWIHCDGSQKKRDNEEQILRQKKKVQLFVEGWCDEGLCVEGLWGDVWRRVVIGAEVDKALLGRFQKKCCFHHYRHCHKLGNSEEAW